MTVLIGILCQDGVVIGADSSATFVAGQHSTIEQKTKKIDIVLDKIIVAGTGSVGLNQRFNEVAKKCFADKNIASLSHIDIAKCLTANGINDFKSTFTTMGQYGSLVAFPANDNFHLCEFALTDFQPELKDEKIWYVSMGSGQTIADPFLGFMRKVFWKNNPPSLQDGIFAVTWILENAIDLNTGGINGPSQIAILDKREGHFSAKLLEDNEIQEHIDNVKGIEEYISKYSNSSKRTVAKDIPEIPKSPSS